MIPDSFPRNVEINIDANKGEAFRLLTIAPDKRRYPHFFFFFIFARNICCGYSLEAPLRLVLMSFHTKIRKIKILFG